MGNKPTIYKQSFKGHQLTKGCLKQTKCLTFKIVVALVNIMNGCAV